VNQRRKGRDAGCRKQPTRRPGIGPIEGSSFNCSLRRIDRSARRALNKRLALSGSGLFAPTKGCRPAFGCESRMLCSRPSHRMKTGGFCDFVSNCLMDKAKLVPSRPNADRSAPVQDPSRSL
jgi:hypothetical protein